MKTVQLNDAGYTADGKWRLVLVEPTPEMVDGANRAIVAGGFFTRKSDFVKGAILASPKPDLPDVDIDAMRREMAEQLETEKSEHLKEWARLDWALKCEANFASGTLSWIDEIGQMQMRVVPSGALRETIDVLMGE